MPLIQVLYFVDSDLVYADLDEQSWRSDTLHQTSTSSSIQQQRTHERINSLLRTNENLSQEIVYKNTNIAKLESAVEKLQKENEELKRRLNTASKSKTVNKELSAIVKQIYQSFSGTECFNISENYGSQHNQTVKNKICDIIKQDHTTYSHVELNDTVRLKFTYEKRGARENQNDVAPAACPKRKRKITARRHSSYESRYKTAKKRGIHTAVMQELSAHDMSDLESENEDTFIVKRPVWRTADIQLALNELDNYSPLLKRRVLGTPSKRSRP